MIPMLGFGFNYDDLQTAQSLGTSQMTTNGPDWISRLTALLPPGQKGAVLRGLVLEVAAIAARNLGSEKALDEDTGSAYCRERLTSGRSIASASELITMAKHCDLEEALFGPDPELLILVDDSELRSSGTALYEHYMECRGDYPEYELIDPSQHSGPQEETVELEYERQMDDFTQLVRDWRDGFLAQLVKDARGVG
jgi:hypothetical protein